MQSSEAKIKDLETLLKPNLHEGECILSYECSPLTRPGDNYGSEMLALNVKLAKLDGSGDKSLLQLVAKKPPNNEQLLAIFQISRTFIKENCTYTKMAPCVDAFENEVGLQEDQKLKVFCECFGARISLDEESKKVDDNALLLLKNLKCENFRTADRVLGFDSEHCKLILTVIFFLSGFPKLLLKAIIIVFVNFIGFSKISCNIHCHQTSQTK